MLNRSLHTYGAILRLLCEAFGVPDTGTPTPARTASRPTPSSSTVPARPSPPSAGSHPRGPRLRPARRAGGDRRVLPGLAPVPGLDDSLVVKECYWVWPRRGPPGDAGNTIDFLVRVHGLTFHQAMELITATSG